MRRFVVLATLLLTGCSGSGFWRYQSDTLDWPWRNPNTPVSSSVNFQRSKGAVVPAQAPILTEAGDIWPGPPAPVPTLKDLQKQELANSDTGTPGAGLAPLPPLPSLPGYELPAQEPGHAAPSSMFPGSAVPLASGRSTPISGGETYHELGNGSSSMPSPIVVPNGNGTSTVISPTGKVTTIPTPGVSQKSPPPQQ